MPAKTTPRQKPTLRTIAEETGFAIATVSRALSDDPRIAEATRRKVHDAADRLNYMPDRAAQRLRTGRTKVIGLLLNPDHEFLGFTNEFMGGIIEALEGTDYAVSVMPDYMHLDRIETVRRILRNGLADGLIFTRTEPFDDRIRLLTEAGLPFVSHGRSEFSTPHAWVDYDNEAFARLAVRRLVELGRTRILMVLPDDRFTFGQHLRYGFLNEVRASGIDFEVPDCVTLDSDPGAIADYLRQRLTQPNAPDGFVCVGEVIALATMAALNDTNKTVGIEADVLAKRASPIFEHVRPRIETVFEDIRATGRHLGDLLLRQISGEPVSGLHVLMEPEDAFAMPQ